MKALRPWQYVLVGLLALWALVEVGSGFVPGFEHNSRFGVLIANDGRIEGVLPHGAAAAAGIRVGDRIVLDRLAPADRDVLAREYKPAGTAVHVVVSRRGRLRNATLVSQPSDTAFAWSTIIATFCATVVCVGIALALLLLRPDVVTWSFYLFACGYSIAQFGSLRMFIGPASFVPLVSTWAIALAIALVGGSLFTARFPNGGRAPASRLLERVLPVGTIITVALFVAYLLLPSDRDVAAWLRVAYQVAIAVLLLLNIVTAIYRHASVTGDERARRRWVIAGTLVALGGLLVDQIARVFFPNDFRGSWLDIVLGIAIVCIPLSVAYAVLRHRVIDVQFVINRALVFGIITSASVLAFSLVEWIIGRELEATRVADYVELGLALALGFSFDKLKGFTDRLVERAFFRRQHLAAERIRRVTEALPHAAAVETVDELLTSEPLHAYGLTSAALFRLDHDGRFARTAAFGWNGSGDTRVAPADPLLAYLAATTKPLALSEAPHKLALPNDSSRPEIAVPIIAGQQLVAFALYGPHASGETLDPEETGTLGDLGVAAAAAYDHLETVGLHDELASLRGEVTALRSVVASIRSGLPSASSVGSRSGGASSPGGTPGSSCG